MSGAWSTTQTWSCLVGGGQPRVSSPQVKNCPFLLFFPFAQLSICSFDQLSLDLHGTSIASGFQWCAWRTKQPTTKSHQEEREWVFKLIQFLKKKKISAEPAGAFFRCWEIGGKARSVSHIKPGLAPPALRFRLQQQVMRVLTEKKRWCLLSLRPGEVTEAELWPLVGKSGVVSPTTCRCFIFFNLQRG